MTVTCQCCGHRWTAEELKKSGVHHFAAPDHKREILEPSGSKWVVVFDGDSAVSRIDQCNQCPVLMMGFTAEG